MFGTRNSSVVLPAIVTVGLIGCISDYRTTMPAVDESPPANYSSDGLLAGFGRADITPPPGFAMAGHGPEGRQAVGYRQRLYVRAMVLQDTAGRRLAIGVADLAYITLPIHRRTGEALVKDGLGPSRLILSATHTHSGPGNMFGNKALNVLASSLPGYDSLLVDFLTDRFVSAIEDAVADLKPAVAAWDTVHVKGLTRNRSLQAYMANVPAPTAHDAYGAVDSVFAMLRVDRCDPSWESCIPKGAFSIFAMHATGNSPINDVYDADIQGVVARGLEEHIRMLPEVDAAFHLFANGTEGDVSPNHQPPAEPFQATTPAHETRCLRHVHFDAGRDPPGPRLTAGLERWVLSETDEIGCTRKAVASISLLGEALTARAIDLHTKIGAKLAHLKRIAQGFSVHSAFKTLYMPTLGAGGNHAVCNQAMAGSPLLGGAEDGPTRLANLRPFWLVDLHIREGESKQGTDCSSPKRDALFGALRWLIGDDGAPTHAQLAVVRLGDALIGVVPAEVTTAAGNRMKTAILNNAPEGVRQPVFVMGLSNGNIHYLTTQEEYGLQHYEGGSTLYGPNTEAAFSDTLARLTRSLRADTQAVDAPEMRLNLGPPVSYFAPPDLGGQPDDLKRDIQSVVCTEEEMIATWTDVRPGAMQISDSRVAEIREAAPQSRLLDWDDRLSVVVRAMRPKGRSRYVWEMRWRPTQGLDSSKDYYFVLPARRTFWGWAPHSERICVFGD